MNETAIKAQALFIGVLSDHVEKATAVVIPPRCAVRISFYHTTHIDHVAAEFKRVGAEFTRVNESLVTICDSLDEAQKLANKLNSLIYAYNDAILSIQFAPGWLSEYLEMQSLGINVIMTERTVITVEDELKRQALKESSNDDSKQYLARRQYAKENILSYSFDILKADVSRFLLANITLPALHEERALSCIDAMFNALSCAVKGKIALESHANSRLVHAIEGKSEYIFEQSSSKEDVAKYRSGVEKVKAAEQFRSKNTLSFDHVNAAIKSPLSDLFSEAELAGQYEAFTGLDLMYSSPYELSDIRKARLESLAESRYCSISEMVAYLLTDLFLEYLRMTSKARHHAALIQLSDALSEQNLYSDAIESIYQSCSFSELVTPEVSDLTPAQKAEYKEYLAAQPVWQACVCCGKNQVQVSAGEDTCSGCLQST